MKTSQGKRNKINGHNYERLWVKRYKEVGYSFCKTSRLAGKLLDNSKVDLAFIPYNHQCKHGVQKGINYFELLKDIEVKLKENYPPNNEQLTYPIVISHKKDRDEIVIMSADSYLELVKKIYTNENINNKND